MGNVPPHRILRIIKTDQETKNLPQVRIHPHLPYPQACGLEARGERQKILAGPSRPSASKPLPWRRRTLPPYCGGGAV